MKPCTETKTYSLKVDPKPKPATFWKST